MVHTVTSESKPPSLLHHLQALQALLDREDRPLAGAELAAAQTALDAALDLARAAPPIVITYNLAADLAGVLEALAERVGSNALAASRADSILATLKHLPATETEEIRNLVSAMLQDMNADAEEIADELESQVKRCNETALPADPSAESREMQPDTAIDSTLIELAGELESLTHSCAERLLDRFDGVATMTVSRPNVIRAEALARIAASRARDLLEHTSHLKAHPGWRVAAGPAPKQERDPAVLTEAARIAHQQLADLRTTIVGTTAKRAQISMLLGQLEVHMSEPMCEIEHSVAVPIVELTQRLLDEVDDALTDAIEDAHDPAAARAA